MTAVEHVLVAGASEPAAADDVHGDEHAEAPYVPSTRMRRTRRTAALRDLVRETRLHPKMFIAPIFVRSGSGVRTPIASLPGVDHVSPDEAVRDAERYAELGLGGVILFGLPDDKDDVGTGAWLDEGIVQQALRRLRDADLPLVVAADACLCEYTSHGHCGPLLVDGLVDNDKTIALLARTAVAQADAGADVVAPSAMMDGQVGAIRAALDSAGLTSTIVMAYSAKAASAFYGPFREAAGSTPAFGDRRAYQMDPSNGREAMREISLDVNEGADIIMVKPATPQLDLIAEARKRWDLPVAAYHVSGEYAMLAAAAERGWIDRRRATLETLTGIARAGADIIITYASAEAATWLREERDA
jgi:porphobilinogen synthase